MNGRLNCAEYDNVFGERLNNLIKTYNTTQIAIAKLCGVQRQSVSLWVLGKTRPDIISVVTIARHFGVSTDFLLGHNLNHSNKTYDEGYVAGVNQATLLIASAIEETLDEFRRKYNDG